MSSAAPTLRQLEALDQIERAWAKRAPLGIRDLGRLLSIRSTNAVNDLLAACERKGLLERPQMKARSFRVTPHGLRHLASYRPKARSLSSSVSGEVGR